jgi:hypothetical protein
MRDDPVADTPEERSRRAILAALAKLYKRNQGAARRANVVGYFLWLLQRECGPTGKARLADLAWQALEMWAEAENATEVT